MSFRERLSYCCAMVISGFSILQFSNMISFVKISPLPSLQIMPHPLYANLPNYGLLIRSLRAVRPNEHIRSRHDLHIL